MAHRYRRTTAISDPMFNRSGGYSLLCMARSFSSRCCFAQCIGYAEPYYVATGSVELRASYSHAVWPGFYFSLRLWIGLGRCMYCGGACAHSRFQPTEPFHPFRVCIYFIFYHGPSPRKYLKVIIASSIFFFFFFFPFQTVVAVVSKGQRVSPVCSGGQSQLKQRRVVTNHLLLFFSRLLILLISFG